MRSRYFVIGLVSSALLSSALLAGCGGSTPVSPASPTPPDSTVSASGPAALVVGGPGPGRGVRGRGRHRQVRHGRCGSHRQTARSHSGNGVHAGRQRAGRRRGRGIREVLRAHLGPAPVTDAADDRESRPLRRTRAAVLLLLRRERGSGRPRVLQHDTRRLADHLAQQRGGRGPRLGAVRVAESRARGLAGRLHARDVAPAAVHVGAQRPTPPTCATSGVC